MGPDFSDRRRVKFDGSPQLERSLRDAAGKVLEQSIHDGRSGVPQYPAPEILVYGLNGRDLTFFNEAYGTKFSVKVVDKIPESGPGITQILVVDKTCETELDQIGEAFSNLSGLYFRNTLVYRSPDIGATCGGSLAASGEISRNKLDLLAEHLKCPFVDEAKLAAESLELWRGTGSGYALGKREDLDRSLMGNVAALPFRDDVGILASRQVRYLLQNDAVFRQAFLDAAWEAVCFGI